MSSKRLLRKRQCGDKVKYSDQTEAVAAIISFRRRNSIYLKSYKCSFCGTWHIGHTKRSLKFYVDNTLLQ